MKGYCKTLPEGLWAAENEEWRLTGDLFVEDPSGGVRFLGRKGDLIQCDRKLILPREIEDVLTTHPKILEAAVIGVPDEHSGESIKAFVVKKDESLTEDELFPSVKQLLSTSPFNTIPFSLHFVDSIPKDSVFGLKHRSPLRKRSNEG